jgi:hypothetical protein
MRIFGSECRKKYPEAASCTCVAEGRTVSPRALSLRSMNFDQHWRTPGIEDVEYFVELPKRYWMDLVIRELPEYVEDAKKYPDDDDLETALRLRGWPDAHDVCADSELASLVADHFSHDLLLEWLGDGPPDEEPGWVINTIDGEG